MTNKELKREILNYYDKKADRMFVSSIIDKINKFDLTNHLVYTNFLDINEQAIAVSILNKLNAYYYIFKPLEDTSRVVIFLLPDYMLKENIEDIFSKYITVVKITPKIKGKLTHREYMGAIYSLGLKEDMIGDIFVYKDNCYLFSFKQNEKYILDNLVKVSKIQVNLSILNVFSDEIKKIRVNFKSIEITIPSLRIDVILSEVFGLSRSKIKDKVDKSDLYVNSKPLYFAAYNVNLGDIISLKKCGKFKIGSIVRKTKSGKIVLNIQKYS